MGTLNFALAVILLLLGIIGVLEKPLLAAVILLAFFRFDSNSIYELTTIGGMQTASGVFNCVIFLVALYGGFALALEDVQHRTVLPIGRRSEARRAFQGDLGEQVGPIEEEAGVRKQL